MRKLNRKSMAIIAVAATVVTAGSAGAATLYKTVSLNIDGQSKTVSGFMQGSVVSFLEKQGVAVSGQDLVEPSRDATMTDGMNVSILHAKKVTIQDGANQPKDYVIAAKTIADLLQQAGIQLNEQDKVNLDLNSALANGQAIQITRREEKVVVTEEKIPFQTERQPDQNKYSGQEEVLTRGVEGTAKVTTRIILENGVEVDRKEDRQVVQEPVTSVVSYGTKKRPVLVASRSGENFTASSKLVMSASAYVGGGRTATGRVAEVGVVAVDPSVIPLGTRLYIEGYGYAVAADTGGAIKGNRIDLVFNTYEEAISFGRRQVIVYIVQ